MRQIRGLSDKLLNNIIKSLDQFSFDIQEALYLC